MKWVAVEGDIYMVFKETEKDVLLQMLSVVRSTDPREQILLDKLVTHLGGTPDPGFPGYEVLQQ